MTLSTPHLKALVSLANNALHVWSWTARTMGATVGYASTTQGEMQVAYVLTLLGL